MEDNIINYGRASSRHWQNKKDFIIKWSFARPYKNSRYTWMVGSGSIVTGARFKLYQDSNNNGKYDAGIGDAYVGSGKISRSNYFLFTQIFAGASAEAYGYADYTADFFVGGNPVGVANWF